MKHHKAVLSSYGEVTTGAFAELLVAEVLGGVRATSNESGYDVLCPDGRKVEVRSRVEGTDSNTSRASLTASKMTIETDVVAVRFNRKYVPIEARLVRKAKLESLYAQYKQAKGLAHIPWAKFCNCTDSINMLPKLLHVYEQIDAQPGIQADPPEKARAIG